MRFKSSDLDSWCEHPLTKALLFSLAEKKVQKDFELAQRVMGASKSTGENLLVLTAEFRGYQQLLSTLLSADLIFDHYLKDLSDIEKFF